MQNVIYNIIANTAGKVITVKSGRAAEFWVLATAFLRRRRCSFAPRAVATPSREFALANICNSKILKMNCHKAEQRRRFLTCVARRCTVFSRISAGAA